MLIAGIILLVVGLVLSLTLILLIPGVILMVVGLVLVIVGSAAGSGTTYYIGPYPPQYPPQPMYPPVPQYPRLPTVACPTCGLQVVDDGRLSRQVVQCSGCGHRYTMP